MTFGIANSKKILACRRGSVAIQIGILMTVLAGIASIGSEIPLLIYKHRQMQNAADAAAWGTAVALKQATPRPHPPRGRRLPPPLAS